jgi:hypothetical protein
MNQHGRMTNEISIAKILDPLGNVFGKYDQIQKANAYQK